MSTIRHEGPFAATVGAAIVGAAIVAAAVLAAGCTAGESGPAAAELKSDRLSLRRGDVTAGAVRGVQMMLLLENKSRQAVQVTVNFRPPAPGIPCTTTRILGPRESKPFLCPQRAVPAGEDYPVYVTTDSIPPGNYPVEVSQTKFWLDPRSADPSGDYLPPLR